MPDKKSLSYGVDRLFIKNHRFNTTLISVNFYLPLTKKGLSCYTLLSSLLTSSCKTCPDFSALNLKQKELYSAVIGGSCDKHGDNLIMRVFCSYLNNSEVGEDIESSAQELLLELLFNPYIEQESFNKDEVAREKRLLIEKIKSKFNEKRRFAIDRTVEEMFKDSPYSASRPGDIKEIEKLDGKSLYNAYIYLLKNAYIRVQVISKEYNNNFDNLFADKIKAFRLDKDYSLQKTVFKDSKTVNTIKEKAEIKGAKLCLGFTRKTEDKTKGSAVFADIFGGGPYSKLFSNVREKLSLCYYCAAKNNKTKGFLMVDSGIELKNVKKAKEQILKEFNDIKNGEFSDELIKTSKKALCDSLKGINDTDLSIDAWYSIRLSNNPESPEEYMEKLKQVTKQDVINAAQEYTLDTVYLLCAEDYDEI